MGGTRAHSGYQHEALLYSGDSQFLDGIVGFVRDGLELGQPCLVAVPRPRLAGLADALGSDARDVQLVDMTDLGDNPARIIPAWREFLDRQGPHGTPVRGVGEPIWSGRADAELAECALHEALLNVAVGPDEPLWLRCPYDVARLGDGALQGARQSHPAVIEGGSRRTSQAYGGADLVDELFAASLPDPPSEHLCREFASGDLVDLRRQVGSYARAAGLAPMRTDDLVLAVAELSTNSLRHGADHGVLRIWRTDEHLVCEVRDDGHIGDPMIGRRAPGTDHEGGRGVWIANQLCDLVQVRSSDQGTVVRVLVRFGPTTVGPTTDSLG
ncbi:anti-sigma factor RsbA family regulatory protein [Angustibacter luteus]